MALLGSKLRQFDTFGESLHLNMRGSRDLKTWIGGLITLAMYIALLVVVVYEARRLFGKEDPTVQSYSIIDVEGTRSYHNLQEWQTGIIVRIGG